MRESPLLKRFERGVTLALTVMMGLVITLAIIELGYVLVVDIVSAPVLILEIDELLELFGLFLLVMVGLELLETLKGYASTAVVRVEVVLVAAFIAVGRKVVTLDLKETSALSLLGLAALLIALAGAYYLLRRTHPASPDIDEGRAGSPPS